MKTIQTPVVRVGSALNDSPFLELSPGSPYNQPAWMNLKLCRQVLPAQSRLSTQQSQDSRGMLCEFQNSQSFSKLRGGMRSKLGKQKRRLVFSHLTVIHLRWKNYCML